MKDPLNQPPSPEIKFPEIAEEIVRMAEVDQDMREKGLDDPELWDNSVDENNTARMKQIIEQIGWPTVSKVGEEVSSRAWLLVQHADRDVEFQDYCLTLMKKEEVGEVSLHDVAYLEDRIRIHRGQPQIYGTQFDEIDGKFVPKATEDSDRLDERRKEMGLPTLAENTDEMYRKYKMKKL